MTADRLIAAAAAVLTMLAVPAAADAPRIQPAAGEKTVRDLNSHHLFTAPPTRGEWLSRADALRKQILFSAGLWPMPPRTPLLPQVTGRAELPDITIENVAIQPIPGFYLCGNLYRPKGDGPFPAVLVAHGHIATGRLADEEDVPRAKPAPEPPPDGRSNHVALSVNLARQGYVVFAYDMVGYTDTLQMPEHRNVFDNLRPWLWNISLLGFQLWDSMRALDFLAGLPYVDSRRIGMTGSSGGGSQTFLLTAVDDRIKAAAPVNMVSAHMQGGCLCENGPGLRVGTDNAEIAALAAPRPLLLVSCTGDWTKNNPQEEWPEIRKVFDLFGVPEKTSVVQFNYQHNYNVESREAVYAWFGRWLLGETDAAKLRETPVSLDTGRMRVWNARTPLPPDAPDQDEILAFLRQRQIDWLDAQWPADTARMNAFRREFRSALALALKTEAPRHVALPAASGARGGKPVLVVAPEGDAQFNDLTSRLGQDGRRVFALVLEPAGAEQDLWKDFYSCYNRTPLGDRVQAVVDALATLAADSKSIDVVGLGQAGIWALFARSLSDVQGTTIVDCGKLDTRDDAQFIPALYAPGIRRAGDVQAAAILSMGSRLYLHNTGESFGANSIERAGQVLDCDMTIRRERMTAAEIAGRLSP